MAVTSWSCEGCTNHCYLTYNGVTSRYCRAFIERGENETAWFGAHLACLDYTTDPEAFDPVVRIHPLHERRNT